MAKNGEDRVDDQRATGGSKAAPQPTEIRADRYEVLFADTVQVATRPDMLALTLYQTIPDPATDPPKGSIRQVMAVVQLPSVVAVQLPRLILSQVVQIAGLSPDVLRLIAEDLGAMRSMVEQIAEEKADEQNPA